MSNRAKPNLSEQCLAVGWPLEQLQISRTEDKRWCVGDTLTSKPELAAAAHIEGSGEVCSWCEGGAINLLIKAAALETLARLNLFDDRSDAVRRHLEAQLTVLSAHVDEVLSSVASVSRDLVARNLQEILSDEFIREAYPRVSLSFAIGLFDMLGNTRLQQITAIFARLPYDYRSGWPDLTVLGSGGVRFVEVKTTDILHESQIRFAHELAHPLAFRCSVLQLLPLKQIGRAVA